MESTMLSQPLWLQVLVGLLLVGGAFWVLAAGIGLVRFPSAMARVHAASKPQVVGLFLLLGAVSALSRQWQVMFFCALVFGLQLITIPISAHILARTIHRTDQEFEEDTVHDDLDADADSEQDSAEDALPRS